LAQTHKTIRQKGKKDVGDCRSFQPAAGVFMKFRLTASLVSFWLLTALTHPAAAIGQRAQVFEKSSEAGIWDHGNEFYLRMDLAELSELKDQKFVWAGFHLESEGLFKGELLVDDFGRNERKWSARAKLLIGPDRSRNFFIEVMNEKGEVIKELFVKAGPLPGLER
jgi:hypothetical protein